MRIDDNITEWFNRIQREIVDDAKSSLTDAGVIIEYTSRPLTPIDQGYLEKSFQQTIFEEPQKVVMEFGYSVVDNPDSLGYDYAYIQHESFPNKRLRGQMYYLDSAVSMEEGHILQLIETDYLSSLSL
ncbi:hypothetical protein [Methanobrevibacter sp. DSM 116169]|uniref:hypothetical protein n=1 Tax=Methanobrevibacter sp. DSM 116169 TaxID=3242727 RepID=UPI0038FC657F